MKLYSLDNSPYAARVLIQIRHKDLPVEVCPPPEPLRTEAFAQRFPLAKIPVLALEDGTQIAESTAIMRFLEAAFPEPPLLPAAPLAQAQDEMLIRFADNHLGPALFPLFGALLAGATTAPEGQVAAVQRELSKLERLLEHLPDSQRRGLSLGDLCIATVMAYVEDLLPRFGEDEAMAALPRVSQWRQWCRSHNPVEETLEAMMAAHRGLLASRGVAAG